MFGRGATSNAFNELEDAPLIFATGTNTTETHPVIALRVKRAVAKGATLIVADPRRIELTDFAQLWLPLKVGTDIALYNAMAHVIVAEELYDREFIANRTEGFDELKEFLRAYTPEYGAQVTGLPRDDIVSAARQYAAAERAAVIYTLGITEHTHGVHNVQSLANLTMLTGNLGIPNAGLNPLRGQNNVQGAGDMACLPFYLPGYQRPEDDQARGRFEAAWGVKLNPKPGITKVTAVEEILEGRLRALYIMGENTVVSDANATKTKQAMEMLDFMVVQDLFLTETALMADVVLPAAAFAEVDGTYTNSDRRVQRVRKAINPPGVARADWEPIAEIATKMGYPMSYGNPSEIWDEAARLAPILSGISYARIEAEGGIQWPCPTPDHPGTPFLHKDTFVSGRGTFMTTPHVPPAEPTDQEYPIVLTTGRRRSTYHTGSQTGRVEALQVLVPHEWLEISPEDAAELRLADGDDADVTSRRGTLRVPVKVTTKSVMGVAFMSFAFPETVLTNLLTTDAHDPISHTAEFKATAVRITKARRSEKDVVQATAR